MPFTQVLDDRLMLQPGKKGLGFAVGTEPLASYFAKSGCEILETDLAKEESNIGWTDNKEHASSKDLPVCSISKVPCKKMINWKKDR